MTPTERLRELLDERRVKWWWSMTKGEEKRVVTWWDTPYFGVVGATDDNTAVILFSHRVAPEQAIEATLGRGECSIKRTYEHDGDHFACSACGYEYPRSNCEPYETSDGRMAWKSLNRWVLACEVPRFCPNCGRKVVG